MKQRKAKAKRRSVKKPVKPTSSGRPSLADAVKARLAEAESELQERLNRRKPEMRTHEFVPKELLDSLEMLFLEPSLGDPVFEDEFSAKQRAELRLLRLVTEAEAFWVASEAFRRGAAEGFIEGRMHEVERHRQTSSTMNAAKRKKPREHDGKTLTLDQRDQAIVAEYPLLRTMMSADDAQYRLAQKYGLGDRQIRNILGAANKAAR